MKKTKKLASKIFYSADSVVEFINKFGHELVSVVVTKGLGFRYEIFYYHEGVEYSWQKGTTRHDLEAEHY